MDQHTLQQLLMSWLMPSFLSAVVAFLLGIVWYHPRVLGGNWLKARGKDAEDRRRTSPAYVLSFPLWFLTAIFFNFMIIYMGIEGSPEIFLISCMLWVAFAMPPIVMGSLYTGYPFAAVAIDAAYQLAGYYALGVTHIVLRSFGVI